MRFLILIAAASLGACSPSGEGEPAAQDEEATAALNVAQEASVPSATSAAESVEIAQEAGALAWTGRYAPTPELCTGGAWDIQETRIVTDGETSCDVDNVARAADNQVTLVLSCTAEGMRANERWDLRRSGTDGLRVARNTGRETVDVDLVRCG